MTISEKNDECPADKGHCQKACHVLSNFWPPYIFMSHLSYMYDNPSSLWQKYTVS